MKILTCVWRKWSLASIICLLTIPVVSQVDYSQVPNPSNCYFFDNVMIHEAPGKTAYLGDLTIRNGLIEQISRNHKAPFDAIKVKADSMHMYAGFIDVLSHAGVKKVEKKESIKVKFPGMPPDEVAGITPYKLASDHYDGSSTGLEALRAAGFTTSQISMDNGMMPGKTAIINTSGNQNPLIADHLNLFSQFKGAGQYYPSTIIAVIAKWKDLYNQSKNQQSYAATYQKNANGMERPDPSKSMEALYDVVNKKSTVFFKANKKLNVYRAVELRNDLNLNMVLTSVPYVGDITDYLAKERVSIALNISTPDTSKVKVDSTRLAEDKEYAGMLKRQQTYLAAHQQNAADLEKANIKFAFSSADAELAKMQDHILSMIKHGLSPEAAHKALTTYPAEMLGVNQLVGTLEKGKLAQIVITDKAYFKEKAKIRMVFTGQELFEMAGETVKSKAATVDIAGTWSYSVDTPDGEQKGLFKIAETAKGSYTIVLVPDDSPEDPETINEVKPNGNKVDFSFVMSEEGFTVPIDVSTTFEEKSFSGSLQFGDFGSFPIKGSLLKKPE